jgi:hypothetical protein
MTRIYISYRRHDSAPVPDALIGKLEEHFGQDSIFIDVDNFADALTESDAVLAIIGRDWANAENKYGRRRIDEPNDYVRAQIETAFEQKKPLIPVLLDDAPMPLASDLPKSIRHLVRRKAQILSTETDDFFQPLIKALEKICKPSASKSGKKKSAAKPKTKPPVKSASASSPYQFVNQTMRKTDKVIGEIVRVFGNFEDDQLYFGKLITGTDDSIPADKLNNAQATYAHSTSGGTVLMLYDNTGGGSAKDGFIVSPYGIYWRNNFYSDPQSAVWWKIETVKESSGYVYNSLFINDAELIVNIGDRDTITKLLAEFLRNVSCKGFFTKA